MIYLSICHHKPNPARETIPLTDNIQSEIGSCPSKYIAAFCVDIQSSPLPLPLHTCKHLPDYFFSDDQLQLLSFIILTVNFPGFPMLLIFLKGTWQRGGFSGVFA
jgi:hypothetical protein